MLKKLFGSKLYVKIYKNKIVIKNLTTDLPPQMFTPDTPFTTTRLLIGSYTPAVKCLNHAIKSSGITFWLMGQPAVLVQPMEMIEGGLSEIEDRFLRQCAFGAGARKVIVWIGAELSNEKAIEKIKNSA